MARYSEVLIPDTQPYRLENASIPRVCIAGAPGNAVADSEGCLRVDLVIDDGRVAALAPRTATTTWSIHCAMRSG